MSERKEQGFYSRVQMNPEGKDFAMAGATNTKHAWQEDAVRSGLDAITAGAWGVTVFERTGTGRMTLILRYRKSGGL